MLLVVTIMEAEAGCQMSLFLHFIASFFLPAVASLAMTHLNESVSERVSQKFRVSEFSITFYSLQACYRIFLYLYVIRKLFSRQQQSSK